MRVQGLLESLGARGVMVQGLPESLGEQGPVNQEIQWHSQVQ